jgi:hypothetical protein
MGHLQGADVSGIADDVVEAIMRKKRVVSCLRLGMFDFISMHCMVIYAGIGNLAGEDGKNEVRADVSHMRNEGDMV